MPAMTVLVVAIRNAWAKARGFQRSLRRFHERVRQSGSRPEVHLEPALAEQQSSRALPLSLSHSPEPCAETTAPTASDVSS